LALDPGLHRLYVASESGTLVVFDVAGPVRKLAEGNAGPNAHSVAVDPDTHLVYLPLNDLAGHPVLGSWHQADRPVSQGTDRHGCAGTPAEGAVHRPADSGDRLAVLFIDRLRIPARGRKSGPARRSGMTSPG